MSNTIITKATVDYELLLRSAKRGCRESLGELLNACRAYLLTVANRSLPKSLQPKIGASDLVQETTLEAQRDFAAFEGDQLEDLIAWMRRILINNVANSVRSFEQTGKRDVKREVAIAEISLNAVRRMQETTVSQLDRMVMEERIELALTRLPCDMRRVIELRNREHMPFKEIGSEMGRSADAARKLWARAIERMHREL